MRWGPVMQDVSTNGLIPGLVCAGRYRIGAPLAEGAMGRLFHAERIRDGRRVVLKCQAAGGASTRQALRAEAASLALLGHSSIVRLVEHGETGDVCFIAMEALDGEDLGTRMREGEIPTRVALRFLEELASALDHMHARGVVHRDIKPANVVLARGGTFERAVIVDFGLATTQPSNEKRGRFLCGTPAYMAPEQALGLEAAIGPATDRYALAAIALELLTGQRPYPNLSIGELLRAIVETPPRKPSELGGFDETVDAVFARAMARDPSRRYETALDMVRAIKAVVPRDSQSTVRTSTPNVTPTVRAKAA